MDDTQASGDNEWLARQRAILASLSPQELERRYRALWRLMDMAQQYEDMEIAYFEQFAGE